MKYFFIDDSIKNKGGASLTLHAIIEPNEDNVELIPTAGLTFKDCLEKKGVWVLGNIVALNETVSTNLLWLLENRTCVKIEFDYGYCAYRSPNTHLLYKKENCKCFSSHCDVPALQSIYKSITEKCKHIFYMSQQQLDLHIENTQVGQASRSVLSSCFLDSDYKLFENLRSKPKNDRYAILKGSPGWHSKAKGYDEAIKFAKNKNLPYDVVETESHKEMIELLAGYKGLIFLPIIQDTCPRIVIEAKLLGLELQINSYCQHITEEWWKNKSLEEITNHLKNRPKYFWDTMENISQDI